MENEPFEDVFPIENGDFPLLCLITGVYLKPPPRQGKPIVNKPFGGAKTPPASLRWPEQSPGGCVGRLVFVLVKKKDPRNTCCSNVKRWKWVGNCNFNQVKLVF